MNEEKNRKLAEWVGFKRVDKPTPWVKWAYCYPDGNLYSFKNFPDFPNDLNACVKYFPPKLVYFRLEFDCRKCPEGADNYTVLVQSGRGSALVSSEGSLATAFSQAVLKLIEAEG